MTPFGCSTRCTVAVLGALDRRRRDSWGDVIARVGEEFFLDEEFRGLSRSRVAPRSRVVGPILLVLEVKNCWGRPSVLPDCIIDVERCFGSVVGGVDVHSGGQVEIGDSITFSRQSGGTSFEVVGS